MAGTGTIPGSGPSITFTEYAIPTPSQPGAIVAGKDGNLWFNHQSTGPSAIERLTPAGMFTLYKTSVTNIGPVGIAAGPDGNVWYTKQQGLGLVTPAGQITERGVPGGRDSAGITAGPDGNLWFTEPIANKIGRSTPAGMFTEYPVPTSNSGPYAIAAGPDGNLWFTEQGASGNKIGRITPAGAVTEYAIPTAASNPYGIAAGKDGNLWFTEQDAHKIGRVTPAGVVTEFSIPSVGSPGPIVGGPDGNLWYAAAGSTNSIGRVTPAGAIAEYAIPSANSDPSGITVGPDGNIWFTELSTNKVGRISNLTGGGNVSPGLGGGSGSGGGTVCTNDTDCLGSGKACGGDVCSWKVTPHVCVPANIMDPGWCTTAAKCWCMGEGATCDSTTHHCSFTTYGGFGAPPDAGIAAN
jgi:streptogramin lyase